MWRRQKTGQSPSDEQQPTAPHPGPAPARRYKKACRWTHRAGTGERTAASTASPTTQRKATTQKQQKLMLLVAGHTETTAPDLWGLRGGHVCLWLSSSPPSNGSSAKRVPSRSQGPYAKSAPQNKKSRSRASKARPQQPAPAGSTLKRWIATGRHPPAGLYLLQRPRPLSISVIPQTIHEYHHYRWHGVTSGRPYRNRAGENSHPALCTAH